MFWQMRLTISSLTKGTEGCFGIPAIGNLYASATIVARLYWKMEGSAADEAVIRKAAERS